MDLFQKCKDFTIIDNVKKEGLYPYFHYLTSGQAPVVEMEGRPVIMIGSNNYLGLTSHPEVVKAALDATKKYGSGCSGSRYLNGTLDLHMELESEIAAFMNKEDCMVFSTGFQSNLGIISAIAGRNDYIIGDKENHASIYDACRLSYAKLLRYEHSDMADLERQLQNVPEDKGKLIVTDGVFSMGGDLCKLPEIVKLAKKYGARIMIDDAHGLGTCGKCGRGTAEHFGLEKDVDLIMGTFSKSLASLGGFLVADRKVVDFVRHNSRPFIYSASIPPSNAASALAALRLIKREPQMVQRLKDLTEFMRKALVERGVRIMPSESPIVPIIVGEDFRTLYACKVLFESGVYVNPVVAPAVPVGTSIIRTSFMATHTEEVLAKAADIIAATLQQIPDDEYFRKIREEKGLTFN
ncbi:MAG: pyridoxal phosphate-dependent aminotransferase family protein [Firmicutes bacterium]|nr:pyridoxal phosphate-dependent aminotransferase family protein [Bacillota bacterium]